jgi:hypothetical protein
LARQPLGSFVSIARLQFGGVASRLLAQPALRAEPVFSC